MILDDFQNIKDYSTCFGDFYIFHCKLLAKVLKTCQPSTLYCMINTIIEDFLTLTDLVSE